MAQQHTQQAKATGSNSSNMASLSVPTSSMEDVVMDASFAPAAAVMDRQLTAQQPSNAMAGPVAAAAGVSRISTPVSMSILDLIMLDHNCARAMYDAYRAPSVTLEQKQLLAWEMIMALSAHAAKEELVVYPVVRSTLGAAMADKLTGDHQLVKNLLAALDTLGADDPSFDMQLRASMDSMVAHMQEEEATMLPQLAAVLDVETQLRLGILFEAAKVRAPTRPHPEILTTALPAPFFENQLAATKLVDASLDQARMPGLAPTAVGLSPLASAAVISSALGAAGAEGGAAGVTAAGGGGGTTTTTTTSGGSDGGVGVPQSLGMPALPQGFDALTPPPASPLAMPQESPLHDDLTLPPPASPAAAGYGQEGVGAGGNSSSSPVQQPAVMGLLAEDVGPLGAGLDPTAVPYPGGIVDQQQQQQQEEEGTMVAAGEPGAAVVPDYTDVGVGGVPGVPTDPQGGGDDMGAAEGMPGDLNGLVNAPVPPAGTAGEVVPGIGGGGGGSSAWTVSPAGMPSGGDFADDIDGTNVEAVKDDVVGRRGRRGPGAGGGAGACRPGGVKSVL